MKEYTTVFTVKIDVKSKMDDLDFAKEMNFEKMKDLLAEMMQSPDVDGCNIIADVTKKTDE